MCHELVTPHCASIHGRLADEDESSFVPSPGSDLPIHLLYHIEKPFSTKYSAGYRKILGGQINKLDRLNRFIGSEEL